MVTQVLGSQIVCQGLGWLDRKFDLAQGCKLGMGVGRGRLAEWKVRDLGKGADNKKELKPT